MQQDNIIVKKFGGTSLRDSKAIEKVALLLKYSLSSLHLQKKHGKILVVTSAIAGFTKDLIQQVENVAMLPDAKEYDSIVSCGEQISAGLLAASLIKMGIKARSIQSWQIDLQTCNNHMNANYQGVNCQEIEKLFMNHDILVVTGFQGIDSKTKRLTTVGLNGSDITAVALASYLSLKQCYIYTDVDGIFSADPNIVNNVKKIDSIGFNEALLLARQGAKVIHKKAIEHAKKNNITIQITSTEKIINEIRKLIEPNANWLTIIKTYGTTINNNKTDTLFKFAIYKKNCSLFRMQPKDYQDTINTCNISNIKPFYQNGTTDLIFSAEDTKQFYNMIQKKHVKNFEKINDLSFITVIGGHYHTILNIATQHKIKTFLSNHLDNKHHILIEDIYCEFILRKIHSQFLEQPTMNAVVNY